MGSPLLETCARIHSILPEKKKICGQKNSSSYFQFLGGSSPSQSSARLLFVTRTSFPTGEATERSRTLAQLAWGQGLKGEVGQRDKPLL